MEILEYLLEQNMLARNSVALSIPLGEEIEKLRKLLAKKTWSCWGEIYEELMSIYLSLPVGP